MLRSAIESACTEMNMSACAARARAIRSRSTRNSSRSRVRTARIPDSALMRPASARAMASVTSFSRVPPCPMAPGSTPPCPASTAMMTSRSPSPGACAARTVFGGCRQLLRRLAKAQYELPALFARGPYAVRGERGSQLHHDPQRAVGLAADAHVRDHPGGCRHSHLARKPRLRQINDHPIGVLEGKELVRRALAQIERDLRRRGARGQMNAAQFRGITE